MDTLIETRGSYALVDLGDGEVLALEPLNKGSGVRVNGDLYPLQDSADRFDRLTVETVTEAQRAVDDAYNRTLVLGLVLALLNQETNLALRSEIAEHCERELVSQT